MDGTVIGGRSASRASVSLKRASPGALPTRCRYEWITTSTKSALSNDGAVRLKVSSEKRHVGEICRQRWRQISRRFASRPARPCSVLKYHWYQRRWAASADTGL